MKTKWQNLSKAQKTWVIIGAVVLLAVATAPFRGSPEEPAEAQEPAPSPAADEDPSEEASEEPEAPAVDADEIMQTWLDTLGIESPIEILSSELPPPADSPTWAITRWENEGDSGMRVYVQEHLDKESARNVAISIFRTGAWDHPELTVVCVNGIDSVHCTTRAKAMPHED